MMCVFHFRFMFYALLLSVLCLHHFHITSQNLNTDSQSGAPLGESLYKLPNKRFNAEYYTIVKRPISMAQIRNKLKQGEYANITEMTADFYLMFDNAKKAFPSNHKAHKDAEKMRKLLNEKLVDIENADTDDEEDEDEEGK